MFSDNEEMEGERVFKRWRVKTEEIVGEFDFQLVTFSLCTFILVASLSETIVMAIHDEISS